MNKITIKQWILSLLFLLVLVFLSACSSGIDNGNSENIEMISGSINANNLSVSEININLDENNDGSIDSIINPDVTGEWSAKTEENIVRVFTDNKDLYPKEYIYSLKDDAYEIEFNSKDHLNVSSLRVEADYKIDLTDFLNIDTTDNINWVPSVLLGVPNLSQEKLIELKNSPELAKENIDVVFEALAYMALNFTTESGNLKLKEGGIAWEFSKPAEIAIGDGKVNCAAAANVIKYLLEDDYQEVGYYWSYTDSEGGHVINYVVNDETYYFFDPVSISSDQSKFPVENADLDQSSDWADGVIEADIEEYIKFWMSFSNEMDIAAIYSNTANAIGSGITEENNLYMYFPKLQEADKISIWSTDNDGIKVLESDFNPGPLENYSDYYPYNNYFEDIGVFEKYDHYQIN